MPKTKKKRAAPKKGGAKKMVLGGSYPVRGNMGGGGGPYFITQAPAQQLPPSALELELQKEKLATQKAKTETIYEEARSRIVEREVNADIMKREAEARLAQGKVEHDIRVSEAKANVAIGTTGSTIQAAQAKADVAVGTTESTIKKAKAEADFIAGTTGFRIRMQEEKASQEKQKTKQMELATANQDIDTKVKKIGYYGRSAKLIGAAGSIALAIGVGAYMGPGPVAETLANKTTGGVEDVFLGTAKGYTSALQNRTEDVRQTSEAATNATLETANAAVQGTQEGVKKFPWKEATKNVTSTVIGTASQIAQGATESIWENTIAGIRGTAQVNPSLALNPQETPAEVIIPEYPPPENKGFMPDFKGFQIDPSKIDTSRSLQIYEHPLIRESRQRVPGLKIPRRDVRTNKEVKDIGTKQVLEARDMRERNLRGYKPPKR